jgi:hypothetical protein
MCHHRAKRKTSAAPSRMVESPQVASAKAIRRAANTAWLLLSTVSIQ